MVDSVTSRGVKITKDKLRDVVNSIRKLAKQEVMIGIPADESARLGEDGKPVGIDNASLGYILETGSPARNIPARPFLAPGVASIKNEAIGRLRKAANS